MILLMPAGEIVCQLLQMRVQGVALMARRQALCGCTVLAGERCVWMKFRCRHDAVTCAFLFMVSRHASMPLSCIHPLVLF